MLEDAKGNWVENLQITEDRWKTIMQETLNGVIRRLESSEKSLDNGVDVAICAGLYTYALEEYGKLLLLKNCKACSGMVMIKYKDWFRRHPDKFRIAIKSLPQDCVMLRLGVWASGIFQKGMWDEGQVADFEARLAIFYSDFTDSGDIEAVPSVDRNLLKKAINKFKTITLGFRLE